MTNKLPIYIYPDYRSTMRDLLKKQQKEKERLEISKTIIEDLLLFTKDLKLMLPHTVNINPTDFAINITLNETSFFLQEAAPIFNKIKTKFKHFSIHKSTYNSTIRLITHVQKTELFTFRIDFNLPINGCKDIKVQTRERTYSTYEKYYIWNDPAIDKLFKG